MKYIFVVLCAMLTNNVHVYNVNQIRFSEKSLTVDDTLIQRKIAGSYATDFTRNETAGITFYNESISFKFGTDSFYFWRSVNINGKGTYAINSDNTLILKFENTKLKKQINSIFRVKNDTAAVPPGKLRIAVNFLYSNGAVTPATVKVYSAAGKELVSASTIRLDHLYVNSEDFPLTIKGYLLQCKPVSLKLEKKGSYLVDLIFEPAENELICNGESWVYKIARLSSNLLELQRTDDFFEIEPKKQFKKYVYISYARM
jgi:hypothetical protein